jgi:flavin-dependent dehydrogenase
LVLENAAGSVVSVDAAGLRIFRRAEFDAALVEAAVAAGARLVAGRVEDVRLGGDEIEVSAGSERYRHDFVVGADGARGLCRRSLGLRGSLGSGGESGSESIGLGASLQGPVPEALALGFPDVADAYCWVFPRPGGASVGIAYDAGRLSHGAAQATLGRFLDRHLDGGAHALDRAHRYRYPIPLYSPSTHGAARRGQKARILLAGDAVGVADPLTREGIRWSLLSGTWAAECLIAGTPDRYADRLEDGLEPELGRAARAARLFYDDPLAQWMVPVARRHAGIRSVLGDLLTCRQGYRGLPRTLLKALAGRYAHSASPPSHSL